ncbi:HAD family hydrolase [Natronomonas marina]|jgi:phosphoglycolate phosphatase-like HAD superfamily hydrolase|uniref:HAD family hydrolase n=1 Tax=Natronomonas marina TaxID=2961939 RepID=UPI0020C9526E|nr:HAD hydrolase-like protein [Natronomonas marina]
MSAADSTDHDTLVFDLDGTLVRLVVDWEAVADAVAETLRERGVSPPDDLWTMLSAADRSGNREAVESVIAEFEREGARASERLPAAGTVPDGTVGVCSLNCEAACRIALSEHGIDGVGAVVGRDTVGTEKPDPEPLLETVRRLDGDPDGTLFVGDSERDARTADQAGTDYLDVSEWLRAYA